MKLKPSLSPLEASLTSLIRVVRETKEEAEIIDSKREECLSSISELETKIADLAAEAKRRSDALQPEFREIDREREALLAEKIEHEKLVRHLETRRGEINLEIAAQLKTFKNLTARIEELNKREEDKEKSIEELEAKKEEVALHISKLAETLTSKAIQEKELDEAIAEKMKEVSSIITEAEQYLADAKQDREKLRKEWETLGIKEKELNAKEQALLVIENRWKKLYGDKGLSFKA